MSIGSAVFALLTVVTSRHTHTQIYSVSFIYTIVAVETIFVALRSLLYCHSACSAVRVIWHSSLVPLCSTENLTDPIYKISRDNLTIILR